MSTLLADVTKETGEYRQTDLFDGRAFNATRLEVTRNGQAAVFEKTKTQEQGRAGRGEVEADARQPRVTSIRRRSTT